MSSSPPFSLQTGLINLPSLPGTGMIHRMWVLLVLGKLV